MPGYRKHLSAGAATGVALIAATHWNSTMAEVVTLTSFWKIAASLAGSLFPDIDIKSKGQKLFYLGLSIMLGVSLALKNVTLLTACGISAVIPPLLPHRGITHEIWFILIAPLSLPFIVSVYQPTQVTFATSLYFYFVAGACSHVLLDLGIRGIIRKFKQSRK